MRLTLCNALDVHVDGCFFANYPYWTWTYYVLRLELVYVVNALNHYYAPRKNNGHKIQYWDTHHRDKSTCIRYASEGPCWRETARGPLPLLSIRASAHLWLRKHLVTCFHLGEKKRIDSSMIFDTHISSSTIKLLAEHLIVIYQE